MQRRSSSESNLADLAILVLNVARELQSRAVHPAVVPLTQTEINVMHFVEHHPGASTSEVATGAGLQRSNLSSALRSLEGHGLMSRQVDGSDGRRVRLHATDKSRESLAILRQQWAHHLDQALGGDTRGVAGAIELLRRVDGELATARAHPVP